LRIDIRAFVLAAGLSALATGAMAAPADIACNRWNECWRTHDRYPNYPAAAKVVFHDEKWASHHTGPGWHWMPDRSDRGYYQHGVWERF